MELRCFGQNKTNYVCRTDQNRRLMRQMSNFTLKSISDSQKKNLSTEMESNQSIKKPYAFMHLDLIAFLY